jgi:hypothetical protein
MLRLAAALFSLALLLLAGAGPIAAAGPKYAAIAVDKASLSYGWAQGYATLAKAKHWALSECRSDSGPSNNCKVVATVQNGCVAVAYKNTAHGHKLGWAIGSTKHAAEQAALNAVGHGAKGLAWACSG